MLKGWSIKDQSIFPVSRRNVYWWVVTNFCFISITLKITQMFALKVQPSKDPRMTPRLRFLTLCWVFPHQRHVLHEYGVLVKQYLAE